MLLLIWIIQSGHSTGSICPQISEKQQRPLIDSTYETREKGTRRRSSD